MFSLDGGGRERGEGALPTRAILQLVKFTKPSSFAEISGGNSAARSCAWKPATTEYMARSSAKSTAEIELMVKDGLLHSAEEQDPSTAGTTITHC